MEQGVPELVKNVGLLTVVTSGTGIEVGEMTEDKRGVCPLFVKDRYKSMNTEEFGASNMLPSPPVGSSLGRDAPPIKGVGTARSCEPPSYIIKQECHSTFSTNPRGNPPHHCESVPPKRPIRDCFNYNEESPTQPTVPKRGLFLEEDNSEDSDLWTKTSGRSASSVLALKTELSRSSPSLLDVLDRSKLFLPLKASYCNGPSGISQSYNCLFRTGDGKLDNNAKNSHNATVSHLEDHGGCSRPSGNLQQKKVHNVQETDSCQTQGSMSHPVSPKHGSALRTNELVLGGVSLDDLQSVDGVDVVSALVASAKVPHAFQASQSPSKLDQTGLPPNNLKSWSSGDSGTWHCSPPALQGDIGKDGSSSLSGKSSNWKQAGTWYGSDEYLALPSHLKQTEVLALKLENLSRLVPPNSSGEALQNIDDWEVSEMNSDSEMYPIFPIRKKHQRRGRISPSSSSDMAPSLDDSIESGPLSDIFSDEDMGAPSPCSRKADSATSDLPSDQPQIQTSGLIQQLIQDIQHQDNYDAIWAKMEGFVSQLDEFICWLQEAMETTENWIPPKAETDRLKLYLETHLSFKLNVESHRTLKETVTEDGRQLLEMMVSHKSGLKDMLQMIASQWKELQRQIKRQHSWILRALDIIKAEILASDVSTEDGTGEGSPEAELQICSLEAKRDAVDQMSLKLFNDQYARSSRRKEIADMSKGNTAGSNGRKTKQNQGDSRKTAPTDEPTLNGTTQASAAQHRTLTDPDPFREKIYPGVKHVPLSALESWTLMWSQSLLDFESEYQDIWEWLVDMESTVMDQHGLMMSEEQQQHLYKRYSVEMTIREPKIRELLGKIAALSRSGPPLSRDLVQRVDLIREKWDLLGMALGLKMLDVVTGPVEQAPRDTLSPETGTMLKQLEVRIRELKGWLRDTELFIFNSCLRRDKEGALDTEKQVQHFKTLCAEIKIRRRGIASILRLCQHLLEDQETCHLDADHQSIELIIVNLERRWEAIVMQAMHWQSRLQKKLGQERETLGLLDSEWMDLNGTGEDAWEWDETDISPKLIGMGKNPCESRQRVQPAVPCHELEAPNDSESEEDFVVEHASSLHCPTITAPFSPPVYQVYSLHNVELFDSNQMSYLKKPPLVLHGKSPNHLQKTLSQDSSFSSTKSLPDLMGEISWVSSTQHGQRGVSRHSECESGIVSEGDTETTNNSEVCLLVDGDGTCISNTEHLETFKAEQGCSSIDQSIKVGSEDHLSVCHSRPASRWMKGNGKELEQGPESPSQVSEEGYQGKGEVLTFPDYSHLQSTPNLQVPVIVTPSYTGDVPASNSAAPQDSHHDTINRIPQHAILKSNQIILPLSSQEPGSESVDGVKNEISLSDGKNLQWSSSGSSLESLSPAGDLLGSRAFRSSDCLQRSMSLDSLLMSYKSNEDLFSGHGSGDNSLSSDSVGELSKRTLDLLKRLEDIESPSDQKIKHSNSDITLQSSSQKMSITGQHSLDIASSVNEDSASSLAELSSSEDTSLCSEDILIQKNTIPDSNASFRKNLSRSLAEESDANVSMIVNVSCTSACTDDEDDSDLLSSSTLTLTEEELGMKDEDDEVSSIATDDDINEESGLMSGIEYIKSELQTWIRPKFMLPQDKKRVSPCKVLKCGKWGSSNRMMAAAETLSIEEILKGSAQRVSEGISQHKKAMASKEQAVSSQAKSKAQENKDQLEDDMENGNVEGIQERLSEGFHRISASENASLFAKERPNGQCYNTKSTRDSLGCMRSPTFTGVIPKDCETIRHRYSLAYPSSLIRSCNVSAPDVTNEDTHTVGTRGKSIQSGAHEQSSDCCGRSEEDFSGSADSCCQGHNEPFEEQIEEDSSVHDFVKEIINMATTALKSKSQPDSEAASPSPLSQIREKVLEHSHRSLQIRKGDFYSYLSLSSHDSDCGEVTSYAEDKSNTPVPQDDNIECFFEACTEDEPSVFESHSPDCIAERTEAVTEAANQLEESKPSIECSNSSSLASQTDNQVSASHSLKEPAMDKVNLSNFQGHSVSHSMNNAWGGPGEGTRDDSFNTWMPKFRDAVPNSVPALDLRFTPWYSRGKERLYCNTTTLTCDSNLGAAQLGALHHASAEGCHAAHPASKPDQGSEFHSAAEAFKRAHDDL